MLSFASAARRILVSSVLHTRSPTPARGRTHVHVHPRVILCSSVCVTPRTQSRPFSYPRGCLVDLPFRLPRYSPGSSYARPSFLFPHSFFPSCSCVRLLRSQLIRKLSLSLWSAAKKKIWKILCALDGFVHLLYIGLRWINMMIFDKHKMRVHCRISRIKVL